MCAGLLNGVPRQAQPSNPPFSRFWRLGPGVRVCRRRILRAGPVLLPESPRTGVLEVRRWMIQEIGAANARLTSSRAGTLRFLQSFG
jgi:hypothetical protein